MIEKFRQSWPARVAAQAANWAQESLTPTLLRRRTLGVAFIACLAAIIYWGLVASNRYVSEAHVIVQSVDMGGNSSSIDIASLLSSGGGASQADLLLLRDYLLSVDMLKKLDEKLNLREHYGSWRRDPLSQMWLKNVSIEWFHRHYLGMTEIELDEHTGVLVIKSQAYDPETAHAITSMLVEEGERFMNEMEHKLARSQVAFLEQQVVEMNDRVIKTRNALLDFQNVNGLGAPDSTASAIAAITNSMEAQLAELRTRQSMLLSYLSPEAPEVIQVNAQIKAVENQLAQEQGRLAAPKGKPLNRVVAEYKRLQMESDFAVDIYKTALGALERGRVEALRSIKKVSVLQTPTMPEYPLEPRRIYNIIVFVLGVMILAGIIHLIAAIIRDHKD